MQLSACLKHIYLSHWEQTAISSFSIPVGLQPDIAEGCLGPGQLPVQMEGIRKLYAGKRGGETVPNICVRLCAYPASRRLVRTGLCHDG